MIGGIYKTGIGGLNYSQFKNNTVEPIGSLVDKLWTNAVHDLYYNKNGINMLLSGVGTNYWNRTGTVLSPLTVGDSVNIVNGTISTDLGYKDNYVLIPVPLGEPFTSFDNLGAELITNGDFAVGNTDWTEGASWTIGAGKASIDTNGVSSLSQAAPPLVLTDATWYAISFEIIDIIPGGTVTPRLDGAIPVVGVAQTTAVAGTFIQYLLATADSLTGLAFESNTASGASIDNISIRAVISFLSSLLGANSIVGALNNLASGVAGGSFSDSGFQLYNTTDPTKRVHYDLSAYSPGAIRYVTLPNRNITLDTITGATSSTIPANKILMSNGTVIVGTDFPTPISTTLGMSSNTEISAVILAKYKCNDIIIENTSGTSVTINIGTTLGGVEIASALVCAAGSLQQVSVNHIYSSTTTQSIFIASSSWTTASIDIHINQTKVMS